MTSTMSAGLESSLKEMLERLAAIQTPQEMLTTEVTTLMAALGKREKEVEQAVQQCKKSLSTSGRYGDRIRRFVVRVRGREANRSAVNDLSKTIHERTA